MKKRIYAVLILLITAALGTACAFQGDQTEESEETETESYRVTITDEEMEAGYASFQMDERIYFEASITPTYMYENGLDSYYIISDCVVEDDESEMPTENSEIEEKASESDGVTEDAEPVNDENTIFGYSLEEFYALLANYSTVDFSEDGTDWSPESCYLRLSSDLAYYPAYLYPSCFLTTYLSNPGGNLSYATAREQGTRIQEFLEQLTGMEISDNWTYYTYSRENLEAAMKEMEVQTGNGTVLYEPADPWEDDIQIEVEEFHEYYSFWFTYEINGIPLSRYPISVYRVSLGAGETPGEGLMEMGYTYIIDSQYFDSAPVSVIASEEGILHAWIERRWSLGEVYKEAEEILPASAILETCEGYLQSEVNVDGLTVTDMSLAYDLGATDQDKEDGIVDVVLRPYWVVSVYNNWSLVTKQFIFDARTGNLIEEKEDASYMY